MKKLFVCLLLLVGGCRDHRPPAPSAEQNVQLNDAADMLNAAGNEGRSERHSDR